MNRFFTADWHFGHANIIVYCHRPFENTHFMDETIISNHNEVVGPDDEVYINGDIGITDCKKVSEYLRRMNGKKFLILGNHDSKLIKHEEVRKHFQWIKEYHELYVQDPTVKHGRQMIILMHYAMRVWNHSHHGSWQLYGHSHGTLPDDNTSLSIDIGVDSHNFYPLEYEEIKVIMSKKTFAPIGT